jgi:hypothetical protein
MYGCNLFLLTHHEMNAWQTGGVHVRPKETFTCSVRARQTLQLATCTHPPDSRSPVFGLLDFRLKPD